MPPEFLLFFLLSLIVSITAATEQQPALIIALEDSDTSTIILAPTPTIQALDIPADNTNTINVNDNNDGAILLPTSHTITQTARVTQTQRPSDPEPIIIFPFHLSLTEHCSPSPSLRLERSTTALLTNGDWITRLVNLGPNTAATVNHRIPDYPRTLRVGPYDTQKGELRFSYKNGAEWGCEWGDGESWRVCGECRASGWDNGEKGGWECDREDGKEWKRVSISLVFYTSFVFVVFLPL